MATDSLFDIGDRETVLRVLKRTVGGIRARWISIVVIAAIFTIAGSAAAVWMPRTYSTASRVLVRRNYVMPALAHPKRAVPIGADSLTQSATELVEDRDALKVLIDKYDLMARWDAERPALLRARDRVKEALFGPEPETDRTEALMEVLARRIRVTVDDEVVRVWAQWSDPQTVVDIVEGAVDAYLEARRKVDVQAIADTHRILEESVESARLEVERHLATVELMQRATNRGRSAVVVPVQAVAEDVDALREDRMAAMAARDAAARLEAGHAQKVRDLEARLTDRLTRETERHPDVIEMKRQLEELLKTPESVRLAQDEEHRLTTAYIKKGGRADDLIDGVARRALTPQAMPVSLPTKEDPADALVYSRSLLESSIETYQDLLDRLKNTGIELETAKAGFEYRYNLLEPARLPRKADAPNGLLMVIGALMAGLGAGALRAVWAEWRAA